MQTSPAGFQVVLSYTSERGERRTRVHTLTLRCSRHLLDTFRHCQAQTLLTFYCKKSKELQAQRLQLGDVMLERVACSCVCNVTWRVSHVHVCVAYSCVYCILSVLTLALTLASCLSSSVSPRACSVLLSAGAPPAGPERGTADGGDGGAGLLQETLQLHLRVPGSGPCDRTHAYTRNASVSRSLTGICECVRVCV